MLPEERQREAFGFEDLVVDVGCSAETVNTLIHVGDFISFSQPLRVLTNNIVAGKALDNRVSLAALTVALEYLQTRQHRWDIVVAATVQEETRLVGGFTVSHSRQPDIAVALDAAFATQPGVSESTAFDLGSGPIIDIGVNVHPFIHQRLKDSAKALEMSFNIYPHARSSGTEAEALQVARAGIPTGLVSIPIRNMHTVVEAADLQDINRVGRLVAEFAACLDDSVMEQLTTSLIRGLTAS
jgi:endoglucanase